MSGPTIPGKLNRFASPPRLKSQTKNEQPKESVDLSAASVGNEKKDVFTPRNVALAAFGAMAVAGGVAAGGPPPEPAPVCFTAPCEFSEDLFHDDTTDYGTLAFQLTRQNDGDVVVQFGQEDLVVNPAEQQYYKSPGASHAGTYQLGESLCEQALDLGGDCITPNLVVIPNGAHGLLQVEQVGPDKIQAGPLTMEFNNKGVTVDSDGNGPDVLFQYEGGTNHFDKW